MRSTFLLSFVFSMFKPLNGVSHALTIGESVSYMQQRFMNRRWTGS